MTPTSKILWFWPVVALLSGCMTVNNASKEVSSSDSEVTVIFGAKSAFRVAMIRGVSSGGEFTANREGFTANIRPEDGYVVTQLPETTGGLLYAVTQFQNERGGEVFGKCEWKQALTFEGQGRKVIYLGDLNVRANGEQIDLEHSNDIEGARLFLNSHYPKLSGQVEYAEPKLLPYAKSDCDSRKASGYRIIFIPRKR